MKKGFLIAIIFLIAGCSTKFTYNNLDWLIHWYIDDYISLTNQQESLFDEHFANWQDWHRSNELARYVEQLKTLKTELQSEQLTAKQISDHLIKSRHHWERLRDHISPELAEMAAKLTDEQVLELYEELEEENQDIQDGLDEYAELSEDKQIKKRVEELSEGVSDYIGRLTDEQKTIIGQYAPAFGSTRASWLQYRKDFQSAARELIDKREQGGFKEAFIELMSHPNQFRSEAYIRLRDENTSTYSLMAEQLYKTLTDKQKRKLLNKIEDMIEDFEDLMRTE